MMGSNDPAMGTNEKKYELHYDRIHYLFLTVFACCLLAIPVVLAIRSGGAQLGIIFIFFSAVFGLFAVNFFRKLTVRDPIIRIDPEGIFDTRAMHTTIPWSAVRSMEFKFIVGSEGASSSRFLLYVEEAHRYRRRAIPFLNFLRRRTNSGQIEEISVKIDCLRESRSQIYDAFNAYGPGLAPETRRKFVSSGLGRIIQKIFAVLSFLVVAIVVVLILLTVIFGPLADPQEYKDTDFVMLTIVELMIAIFFIGVGRGLWRD